MWFTVIGCEKGEKVSFAVIEAVQQCPVIWPYLHAMIGRNYHLFGSTEKGPGSKRSVKARKSSEDWKASGNSKSNPSESRPRKHMLYYTGASAESAKNSLTATSQIKNAYLNSRARNYTIITVFSQTQKTINGVYLYFF